MNQNMEKDLDIEVVKSDTILKSLEEAAKITGMGLKGFRKLPDKYRSDFPYVRAGAKKLVIMEDLTAWLRKHRGEDLCGK